MKLDKNYKVRVSPEQRRKIHSLILLDGGEVSYGLKPQLQDEFLVIENEHGSVVIYYTDQDIFLSAEQQEIQADDLIALLTDLSKSAENPPQDMELTPEFETEASEPKFKVRDKVYCLLLEPKIFTILEVDGDNDNDVQFAGEFGWASGYSCCHANQENYERLQAIFPRIEFEQPPKPDAVERPMTLIEKLEKKSEVWQMMLADDAPFPYHYMAGKLNAFRETVNIVKQHSDWISVDERLPENNVFVLVWLKSGYPEVLRRREYEHPNEPSTFIWEKLCCNGYFTDWDITAWQPIQPPSEVQDD